VDYKDPSRHSTVGGCQLRTGSRTNTSGRGAMHVWMRVCGNTKKGPRGGENPRNAGRWEKGREWRWEEDERMRRGEEEGKRKKEKKGKEEDEKGKGMGKKGND